MARSVDWVLFKRPFDESSRTWGRGSTASVIALDIWNTVRSPTRSATGFETYTVSRTRRALHDIGSTGKTAAVLAAVVP